jgi:hypothetical protein
MKDSLPERDPGEDDQQPTESPRHRFFGRIRWLVTPGGALCIRKH